MSGTFNLADYATVDERIDKYWGAHPKPEGSIQTEIIWVSNDGLSVAIKATVYMGERILATGIAQEERLTGEDKWGKPVKGANTSSWWENCETSAIGRALANMGMSLSKRASREEMQKVERYDQNRKPVERDPDDDLPEYVPANRPAPPARTTPPAAQPVAPDGPVAQPLPTVLAKLRQLEKDKATWPSMKVYADAQWDLADPEGQEAINAEMKAIAARRRGGVALVPPASNAG